MKFSSSSLALLSAALLPVVSALAVAQDDTCSAAGCPKIDNLLINVDCDETSYNKVYTAMQKTASAILKTRSHQWADTMTHRMAYQEAFGQPNGEPAMNIDICMNKLAQWSAGQRRRTLRTKCWVPNAGFAAYDGSHPDEAAILFSASFMQTPIEENFDNVQMSTPTPVRAIVHELAHAICGLNDEGVGRYSDRESWVQNRDQGYWGPIANTPDAYAAYVVFAMKYENTYNLQRVRSRVTSE